MKSLLPVLIKKNDFCMCSSAAFTPMDPIIASLTLRKKASCSSTVSTPCKNHQPKPPQKKTKSNQPSENSVPNHQAYFYFPSK